MYYSNSIEILGLIDEDFINYKKPAMVIEFPKCSFKCDKEFGTRICQNGSLASAPRITISITDLIDRYMNNPITEAIVCQGLEPFDSVDDLFALIDYFRQATKDDIIIYTGYTKEELETSKIYRMTGINENNIKTEKISFLTFLKKYDNIIIKYGRYKPFNDPHYDEVLGVNLASDNQYAERIS